MLIRRIATIAALAATTLGIAAPAHAADTRSQARVTINNQTASTHQLKLVGRLAGDKARWTAETPREGFVLNTAEYNTFVIQAIDRSAAPRGELFFLDLQDKSSFSIRLAAQGLLKPDNRGGIWGSTTGDLSLDPSAPFGSHSGRSTSYHVAVFGF